MVILEEIKVVFLIWCILESFVIFYVYSCILSPQSYASYSG